MANPLYDNLFGRHAGQATPFLYLSHGKTISHETFLRMAARYANVFAKMGLSIGDRVAVQIDKSPQALAVYAASVQSGLVYLPLNTAYTPKEVSYFVENSGASLFICQESKGNELHTVALNAGAKLETLNADDTGTFAAQAKIMSADYDTVDRDAEDLVALLYTSGTTGRSKGTMLSQNNLLSNAQTLVDIWKFSAGDVLLHALPIFHTHGLFVATNVTLLAGGSMIFIPKFDLDAVIDNISSATTMMGVPTFYTRLLNDSRFTKEIAQHMRLFVSGSAPLLAETHLKFEARTGHRILERYGMTETNMNTSNPFEGERRAGTVGFPLPGVEIKITDSKTGKKLVDGEIGEIEVRGPNVFKGYWQMPEKTAEELRIDGFFITGDLGRIDTDGYLHISGRNKDVIISGGYNIYPKEIELLLDAQPGVMESAIIGLPHKDLGEAVVGILVQNNDSSPDLVQIARNITESLAKYKQPRKLFVINELPRNTMGKVQKNRLREDYQTVFKNIDD
ncbi:MAG: malonyl-CoA synthase [SAR324 cluster bacterium]|nr:malonyl-CoA synthase [SAR324 cluster bacterium]